MGLHAIIPTMPHRRDAWTERAGNGVLIDERGVVLTIGYLVTEAETIWLHLNDGRVVPAMCRLRPVDRLRAGAGAREARPAGLPLGDSTMIPLEKRV